MTDIQATGRGRPGTQARGEDTHRRILEAALDLFAAQGYEGASTQQIAGGGGRGGRGREGEKKEGAGVNLPAIRYYFGNKRRPLPRHHRGPRGRHRTAHGRGGAPHPGRARHPDSTHAGLTELLCEMLETFVALVTSGTQVESRQLIFARAEVEEPPGLDRLHDNGMRRDLQSLPPLCSRAHPRQARDGSGNDAAHDGAGRAGRHLLQQQQDDPS